VCLFRRGSRSPWSKKWETRACSGAGVRRQDFGGRVGADAIRTLLEPFDFLRVITSTSCSLSRNSSGSSSGDGGVVCGVEKTRSGSEYSIARHARRTSGDCGEPGILCRVACRAVFSCGWRRGQRCAQCRGVGLGCSPWPRSLVLCARGCRSTPCRSSRRSWSGTRRASARS
jgi:hypothetical protein